MSAPVTPVISAREIDGVAEGVKSELAAGRFELGEGATRSLFEGVISFGAHRLVDTVDEALSAATEIGFPVVLKLLAPTVLHKSDLGLVITNIKDRAQLTSAATTLLERADIAVGDSSWRLSVQTQLRGAEFAIGVRRNELGAFCMVASGGVLIELLDDSAIAMAPLNLREALDLVDRLRVGPILRGYRGSAKLDREAFAEMLVRVSELVERIPEISEMDFNPVFVNADGAFAADARCVLRVPGGEFDHSLPDGDAVRRIFQPNGIAVIGGSRSANKPGGLLLEYMKKHGHRGSLIAVNPRDLKMEGVQTYPSLSAVKQPIDLACIAVPAKAVRGAIEECVRNDVRAGIVFSSGFAESGAVGAQAQRDLVAAAAGTFRFVGPNSIGVASPAHELFATFGMSLAGELPPLGPVALVSQSGAISSALISRSREFNVGLSHWISTGNEADLGVADYIDYLADDPSTSVICLFLEVVRRPSAFAAACLRAREAGKALIAFKTGRSEAGQAAAASHTGAMTGDDQIYDAFLNACGVLRVTELNGLFTAAQGIIHLGQVRGPRVGIISMSGGACSILADLCEEAGLEVPELPRETQDQLAALLPSFGGLRNPVDVTAQGIGSPELVHATLEAVRASGVVDAVIVQLSTNADPGAEAMARDLVATPDSPVPFLVGRLGSAALAPRALSVYGEAGVHVFTWPEQLVQATRAAVFHGRSVRLAREQRAAQAAV